LIGDEIFRPIIPNFSCEEIGYAVFNSKKVGVRVEFYRMVQKLVRYSSQGFPPLKICKKISGDFAKFTVNYSSPVRPVYLAVKSVDLLRLLGHSQGHLFKDCPSRESRAKPGLLQLAVFLISEIGNLIKPDSCRIPRYFRD